MDKKEFKSIWISCRHENAIKTLLVNFRFQTRYQVKYMEGRNYGQLN
uniref:Uncharacterized protein n=1 Tax=Arundo donax TaxID=35708 RepID=A0A0A9MJI3_ARUDO